MLSSNNLININDIYVIGIYLYAHIGKFSSSKFHKENSNLFFWKLDLYIDSKWKVEIFNLIIGFVWTIN